MSAWDADDPARLPVRSIALPRDGGVTNPATAGRYSVFTAPDVAKRINCERRRLAEHDPGAEGQVGAYAQGLRDALVPLANAHTPIERECLTDEDCERARAALYGPNVVLSGARTDLDAPPAAPVVQLRIARTATEGTP